jgi:hypothetical protein
VGKKPPAVESGRSPAPVFAHAIPDEGRSHVLDQSVIAAFAALALTFPTPSTLTYAAWPAV